MRTTLTPTKKTLIPPWSARGAAVLWLLALAACGSSSPSSTAGDSGAPDAKETQDTGPAADTGTDTGAKKDGGSDACPVCVVGTAVIGQCCLE